MVRKTKGIELQIVSILKESKKQLSPGEIGLIILKEENPRIIEHGRMMSLVRHHLKQLVENETLIKEEFKTGFVYSIRKK